MKWVLLSFFILPIIALKKDFLMILGAKIQSQRCARFERTLLVENLKFAKCEFLWEKKLSN